MSTRQLRNARITSTSLGTEDHGILTAFVHLDYGGSGQGFGGYSLDGVPSERAPGSRRSPSPAAGLFIARVLEVLGVATWEKLPGTYCRVDADFGKVYRIGHPLKDVWFDPADEFEALRQRQERP